VANPNGIEIIQPGVARRRQPWEPHAPHASTLKGLNHRVNDAAIRTTGNATLEPGA